MFFPALARRDCNDLSSEPRTKRNSAAQPCRQSLTTKGVGVRTRILILHRSIAKPTPPSSLQIRQLAIGPPPCAPVTFWRKTHSPTRCNGLSSRLFARRSATSPMQYEIRAIKGTEGIVRLALDAADEAAARDQARAQGFTVLSARPRGVFGGFALPWRRGFPAAPLQPGTARAALGRPVAHRSVRHDGGQGDARGEPQAACRRARPPLRGSIAVGGARRVSAGVSAALRRDGARGRAHRRPDRGARALHRLPGPPRPGQEEGAERIDLPGRAALRRRTGDAVPARLRGAAIRGHLRRGRVASCRSSRAC